jgi:drug/metabolite transporter (DMT)-like permease
MSKTNNPFLILKSKSPSFILLILVIIIWGTSSGIVRLFTQEGMNYKGIILLAGIVIFLSFLAALLMLGVTSFFDTFKKHPFNELKKLVGMGILAFFIYPICYFYGISGNAPGNANVLNYLWPAVAFIVAAKGSEKLTSMNVIAFLMALTGAIIALLKGISIEQNTGNILHLLSALIGGIAYGFYSARIKRNIPVSDNGTQMSGFNRITIMLFFCTILHFFVLLYFFLFDKSVVYLTYSSV